MSFHQLGSDISFLWALDATGSPLGKPDFDVKITKQQLREYDRWLPVVTYLEDGLTAYTAPTATTKGLATFVYTPQWVGRHIVTLSTGTGDSYTVVARREIFVVDVPSYIEAGVTPNTSRCPIIPPSAPQLQTPIESSFGAPGWSDFTGQMLALGYRASDDLVLVSNRKVSPFARQILITDSSLSAPTVAFDLTNLTGWVTGTFKEIQYIEYSPKLDTWVMACGREQWFYCTASDPTIVSNWTLVPKPTSWVGASNNIKALVWDGGLEMFVVSGDGGFSSAPMQVSIDGVNWSDWDDYQVLGGVKPDLINKYKRFSDFNGNSFHMAFQQEEYIFKSGDSGAGVLSTAASGWDKTPNNGVMLSTSVINADHLCTDGDVVLTCTGARFNAAADPTSWPNGYGVDFNENCWGPNGYGNQGWYDTDMGWSNTNYSKMCILYIPHLSRPWVVFRKATGAADANAGWFDCASVPQIYGATARTSGNAPQFTKCTVEPFKTMNDEYDLNSHHYMPWNPTKNTTQGHYEQAQDADHMLGTNGWWCAMTTAISRADDYIVFQKPY